MKQGKKYIKIAIILFISVLLSEVIIFNFRFWESQFFTKVEGYSVEYDGNKAVISDINAPVKNIYFKKPGFMEDAPISLQITISDEACTDLALSETEVINVINESNYIRIYANGNVSRIVISASGTSIDKDVYNLSSENTEIRLNAVRPFNFRIKRFALILFIVYLLAVFMPKSPIYQISLFNEKMEVTLGKRLSIYALLMMLVLLWGGTALCFQGFPGLAYHNINYVEAIFSYQAEAILDGHVYLNQQPPSYLSQMENPYDNHKRLELMKETGEPFQLDFAYFNGRYYSYYGIVPTLIFYIPFIKAVGIPPNNSFAVILFSVLYLSACLRLTRSLCRRKNRQISLGMYFLLSIALVFGSGAFYCAHTPKVYSVPFISALAFAVSGLVCWFRATETKTGEDDALFKRWLLAGSICMGLAIGCRPTFGAFILLAFPIFAEEIKQRKFFSVKGLANTLCVILPVFICGCGLLYFNYIRFGSPLDFGYKYNLNNSDLVHTRTHASRLFLGTFEYLFQPINVTGTYPYIRMADDFKTQTDYLGYIFYDPVYCGLLALAPLSLFVLLIRKRKATLKKNYFYQYSIVSLILALLLLVVNIEQGGISMRYQLEFSLFLVIPATIVLLDIENGLKEKSEKIQGVFLRFILFFVVYTVLANLVMALGTDKLSPMIVLATKQFYSLKYLFFVPR